MPVYNRNGEMLHSVFSADGSSAISAYAIDGTKVFPTGRDYSQYTVSTLFRYPVTKMQGFAVYGGKIAQVREGYSLHIIDISTGTKLREVSMNMGHGNSCQFSGEFYDSEDEFPLFYIRNDGIWVYRIQNTSSTLIRKYNFSSSIIGTYVAGFGIDSENRRLYTASYTEGTYESKTGQMRICEWDMDDETEVSAGVYELALLRSNDFAWFYRYDAVQGCCCHDGYFFIGSGISGKEDIVLVDQSTLQIAYNISLGTGGEVEGCAWVGDEYLIVGQKISTYSYRKIVFSA